METRRRGGILTLTLVAAVLGACEAGTEPEGPAPFDAQAALADHEALDAILASPTMEGFRAMAGMVSLDTFHPGGGIALAVGRELRAPRADGDARAFAAALADAAGSLPLRAAPAPVISPLHRGKTFVYDADKRRYVVDPDRTDAPATGVRFVIYEPGEGGKPDPERPIGHADLIDEGDGSAEDIALRLVVVEDGRTWLDYRTTLDALTDGGRITVDGFVRDRNDRLDFAIDVRGTKGPDRSTLDVTFEMRIDRRDFRITGSVTGVEEESGGSGDVDVTVRHGDRSLRVDLSGTATTIEGAVHLDGDVFALVSGHPDDPVFTDADGNPLTGAELLVLRHVVDIVEDVFDLFEDLMDPIDEIVILAVIL